MKRRNTCEIKTFQTAIVRREQDNDCGDDSELL